MSIAKRAELSRDNPARLDATVALLEIGTERSQTEAVACLRGSPDLIGVSLTDALRRCQRPVAAALWLLSSGIRGKLRILEILSAIRPNEISVTEINSPGVSEAQALLLEGEPDSTELTVIDAIGPAQQIWPQLIGKLKHVVSSFPLSDARVAICLRIAARHGAAPHLRDDALSRLVDGELEGTTQGVSTVLYLVQLYSAEPAVHAAVPKLVRQCLQRGFYSLAARYMVLFPDSHGVSLDEMVPHFERTVREMRIGGLLEFRTLFADPRHKSYVLKVLDRLIVDRNYTTMLSLSGQLQAFFPERREELKKVVLAEIKRGARPRTLIRLIRAFGMETEFAGKAVLIRTGTKDWMLVDLANGSICRQSRLGWNVAWLRTSYSGGFGPVSSH